MFAAPSQASADITGVFFNHTVSGSQIPCTAQPDGVRVCHGTYDGSNPPDLRLWSWDKTTPLEVYVILPPASSRITSVYVMIYRTVRGARCRFLRGGGKVTQPRSCTRPLEFRATGGIRWTLRLRLRIPPGTYLVRSDAVDASERHQRHTAASVTQITVRH